MKRMPPFLHMSGRTSKNRHCDIQTYNDIPMHMAALPYASIVGWKKRNNHCKVQNLEGVSWWHSKGIARLDFFCRIEVVKSQRGGACRLISSCGFPQEKNLKMLGEVLLLMAEIRRSPPGMVLKPYKYIMVEKLPTSTGEFTGFQNHQQYDLDLDLPPTQPLTDPKHVINIILVVTKKLVKGTTETMTL